MEKSAVCPKCAYSEPSNEEFSICPKCGVIVKKFYETQPTRQKIELERLEKKKLEQERLEKKKKEEKELSKIRNEQARKEELRNLQDDKFRQEQKIIDTHRSLWKRLSFGGILVGILGGVLLIAGLMTDPTIGGEVVNTHKLHIKQTFYYFSGVCFILSGIKYGVDVLLTALADIHRTIKDQTAQK